MILAITSTTWVQLNGVVVALPAALVSWAAVEQARDAASRSAGFSPVLQLSNLSDQELA